MSSDQFTATIKGVEHTNQDDDHMNERVRGHIYGDTLGRFPDGQRILTARVVNQEGNIITTRSGHVYRLEYVDYDYDDEDHAA
jgi:hypothetical protein